MFRNFFNQVISIAVLVAVIIGVFYLAGIILMGVIVAGAIGLILFLYFRFRQNQGNRPPDTRNR